MVPEIMRETLENARPAVAQGEVASYIPELKKADKNQLGLSIFTMEGERYSVGDTKVRFGISRVFPR